MNSSEENRINIYKKSNPLIQDLYGSDNLSKATTGVINEYSISNGGLFYDFVGDTVLGIYNTADFPKLLQTKFNLSADDAQKINGIFSELFSTVREEEEKQKTIKKEELDKLAQTFEQANKNRPPEIQPEIQPEIIPEPAKPMTPTHNIQALRTMQADMNRIHGYGTQAPVEEEEGVFKSSQAELTKAPQATTPPPAASAPQITSPEPVNIPPIPSAPETALSTLQTKPNTPPVPPNSEVSTQPPISPTPASPEPAKPNITTANSVQDAIAGFAKEIENPQTNTDGSMPIPIKNNIGNQ